MVKRKGPKRLEKIIYTLILGLAIVAFWRGAWNLMDFYIFPNDIILSSWITLLAGAIILVLTRNFVKRLI